MARQPEDQAFMKPLSQRSLRTGAASPRQRTVRPGPKMAVRVLTAIVSGVWLSMAPTTSALSDEELVSSQFDFGEGTPFKGQITLGDIQVVLLTTNTEPYGRTSFRDQVTDIPAEVLFCFSQRVGEFRISFSRILAGEILRNFSAGPPQAIEGDLFDQGDLTYTVPAEVGDYGKGTLIWRKLNARSFGFVIDNPRGWATAVDGFAVSAATAGEDAIADDRRVDAPDLEACKLLYRRQQALPSDDAGSASGRAP